MSRPAPLKALEDNVKSGTSPFVRRFVSFAVAGILVVVLAACTGRGGGYLPPQPACSLVRRRSASRSAARTATSRSSSPTTTRAATPSARRSGSMGPSTRSTRCWNLRSVSARTRLPAGNQLIFLGRYRLTSSAPSGFPAACKTTTPLCRFEVIVQDNDRNLTPSPGDFFSIKLSTVTAPCPSDPLISRAATPSPDRVLRAGRLSGGW